MKRIVLGFAALSLLGSCGGDGTYYTEAVGVVSRDVAVAQKSTIQNALKLNFQSATSETPTGLGRRETGLDTCDTISPETPVDADSDGVSATKTVTWACNNVADSGYTLSRNGTYTETDQDDTKAYGGWKFEYAIEGSHQSGRSNSESYKYNGHHTFNKEGDTSWKYTSNFQGESENTSSRAYTAKSKYGSNWNTTVTTDDTASPPTGGSVTFSGFYGHSTETTGTPPDGHYLPHNYVLSVTSEGLKFQSASCTNFYKEGSITLTDTAGNVIKYTYTCTAVTVTFNGETI